MSIERRWGFRHGLIIALLVTLLSIAAVNAQQPSLLIEVGQNQAGTLADAPERYLLNSDTPQSVHIQVLGITEGLAPRFRVLDPNGILIAEVGNSAEISIIEGSVTLSVPGSYIIEVDSANNISGDFLISVQAGEPLAPPEPLVLGELQNASLDADTTRQAYSFSASSIDVLWLTVLTLDPVTSGATIALTDADTGELRALSDARLGGVRYRILTGTMNYLLEVTFSGGDEVQPYSVCLETESGSVVCDGAASPLVEPVVTQNSLTPAVTTTLNASGLCSVRSAGAASINVRIGPGTGYDVVAQLPLGNSAPVIGRLADNSWYEVNVGGVIGWVSAGVVLLDGNCAGLAVIAPPVLPTSAATQPTNTTPTATGTPEPTPTVPTSTPSPTPTPTQGGTTGGTTDPSAPIDAGGVLVPMDTRPDLYVSVFSFGKRPTPTDEYAYFLTLEVANTMGQPVPPYVIRVCIDGACEDFNSSGAGVGGFGRTWNFPSSYAGRTVPVIVAVDFHNDVDESNDTNNLYQTDIYFEPF